MKERGNERRTPERLGSEHEGLFSSSVSEKRPLPGVALSPRARGGRGHGRGGARGLEGA